MIRYELKLWALSVAILMTSTGCDHMNRNAKIKELDASVKDIASVGEENLSYEHQREKQLLLDKAAALKSSVRDIPAAEQRYSEDEKRLEREIEAFKRESATFDRIAYVDASQKLWKIHKETIDQELAICESRINRLNYSLRRNAQKSIEFLRTKQDDAAIRLRNLSELSGPSWEHKKKNMEKAWKELEIAWVNVKSHFRS